MATVTSHMARANENLAVAALLADSGYFRLSLTNSYYAAFNAVSACMLTINLTYVKHATILGDFNKRFVHTKKVNVPYKVVDALFKGRQQTDYGDMLSYSREDAVVAYNAAVIVIDAVKDYLQQWKSK